MLVWFIIMCEYLDIFELDIFDFKKIKISDTKIIYYMIAMMVD